MIDKSRERALEVARNWIDEWAYLSADEQEIPALADLLLEFARVARSEEAGWWYARHGIIAERERIAQLQPQPAKKGTGT